MTLHVPEGYIATTPIEQVVYVPGAEGGNVGYVYLGLYPKAGAAGGGSILPYSGMANNSVLLGALALFAIGSMVSVGLGLSRRRA